MPLSLAKTKSGSLLLKCRAASGKSAFLPNDGSAPDWPMLDKTGSVWDDLRRQRGKLFKRGDSTARASARLRSPGNFISNALPCGVF